MPGDLLGLLPPAAGEVERPLHPAGEVWWRVRQQQRAGRLNGDGDMTTPSTTGIVIEAFAVRRHTPKGVWLAAARRTEEGDLVDRFVRKKAKRRWACHTQAQALRSFTKRKQAQRRLLRTQIERSSIAEAIARQELVRVTAKEGDE